MLVVRPHNSAGTRVELVQLLVRAAGEELVLVVLVGVVLDAVRKGAVREGGRDLASLRVPLADEVVVGRGEERRAVPVEVHVLHSTVVSVVRHHRLVRRRCAPQLDLTLHAARREHVADRRQPTHAVHTLVVAVERVEELRRRVVLDGLRLLRRVEHDVAALVVVELSDVLLRLRLLRDDALRLLVVAVFLVVHVVSLRVVGFVGEVLDRDAADVRGHVAARVAHHSHLQLVALHHLSALRHHRRLAQALPLLLLLLLRLLLLPLPPQPLRVPGGLLLRLPVGELHAVLRAQVLLKQVRVHEALVDAPGKRVAVRHVLGLPRVRGAHGGGVHLVCAQVRRHLGAAAHLQRHIHLLDEVGGDVHPRALEARDFRRARHCRCAAANEVQIL
eukprot:Rhum_TRINITY_DN2882_c0_g1::Rhum_TRINITY_DN2882_c0_g1_i1::g.8738::m.8738